MAATTVKDELSGIFPAEQSREFMEGSTFPSVVSGEFEPFVSVDAKPNVGTVDFLVMVVNETEFRQVARVMKPIDGIKRAFLGFIHARVSYFIGKLNGKTAVVVQSTPSSFGGTGSHNTAQAAITLWKPRIVVSLGIAFGTPATIVAKNDQLRLGDVLVSEIIYLYDHQRASVDSNEPRETPRSVSSHLIQGLRNSALKWKSGVPVVMGDHAPSVIFGGMLSGGSLVDNADVHRKLVALFPSYAKIVGGEMEACGISDAADTTPFVVIKAIADWGMNKVHKLAQPGAAFAAASFLHFAAPTMTEVVPEPTSWSNHKLPALTMKLEDAGNIVQDNVERILVSHSAIEAKKAELTAVKAEIDAILENSYRELVDRKKAFENQLAGFEEDYNKIAEAIDAALPADCGVIETEKFRLTRVVRGKLSITKDIVEKHVSTYQLGAILSEGYRVPTCPIKVTSKTAKKRAATSSRPKKRIVTDDDMSYDGEQDDENDE